MIKNISVLGAGTMGHGIAISFARYGYPVRIFDSNSAVFDKVREQMETELCEMAECGLLEESQVPEIQKRISLIEDMEACVKDADYVIEAVPEILSLKKQIFGQLSEMCGPDTIFASNTSGLKLSEMIEDLPEDRKKRAMVCHWFNPPYIIPAVELSHFGNMPEDTYQEVKDLYNRIGKKPITVRKDINGLIANRIQHGLVREALSLIESGAASAEDVEAAVTYGPCFRLATVGMLEICDMNGNDVWAATAQNLWPSLDNNNQSSKLLDKMVEEGKLGIKSGEGFYSYSDEEKQEKKDYFLKRLMAQLKLQQEVGKL